MKKKIIAHSDDVRDDGKKSSGSGHSRQEYLERLAKTFFGSSTLPHHTRTVDGTVASSSIEHNNSGTEFKNEFKQIENNEDMLSIHIDKLSKSNQLSFKSFTNKATQLNGDRHINMLLENNKNWARTKNEEEPDFLKKLGNFPPCC